MYLVPDCAGCDCGTPFALNVCFAWPCFYYCAAAHTEQLSALLRRHCITVLSGVLWAAARRCPSPYFCSCIGASFKRKTCAAGSAVAYVLAFEQSLCPGRVCFLACRRSMLQAALARCLQQAAYLLVQFMCAEVL